MQSCEYPESTPCGVAFTWRKSHRGCRLQREGPEQLLLLPATGVTAAWKAGVKRCKEAHLHRENGCLACLPFIRRLVPNPLPIVHIYYFSMMFLRCKYDHHTFYHMHHKIRLWLCHCRPPWTVFTTCAQFNMIQPVATQTMSISCSSSTLLLFPRLLPCRIFSESPTLSYRVWKQQTSFHRAIKGVTVNANQ